jgi:hypothetical protein
MARDSVKYREVVNLFRAWLDPYDSEVEALIQQMKDLNLQQDTEAEVTDIRRRIRELDTEAGGQEEVQVELEDADFVWIKNRWFNAKGFGTTDRELLDIYAKITVSINEASSTQKKGDRVVPIRPEQKVLEDEPPAEVSQ